jgi:hypothetical protein
MLLCLQALLQSHSQFLLVFNYQDPHRFLPYSIRIWPASTY